MVTACKDLESTMLFKKINNCLCFFHDIKSIVGQFDKNRRLRLPGNTYNTLASEGGGGGGGGGVTQHKHFSANKTFSNEPYIEIVTPFKIRLKNCSAKIFTRKKGSPENLFPIALISNPL